MLPISDIKRLFGSVTTESKVHDCYVVPPQHVAKLYTLADQSGYTELWAFVASIFPHTANYDCRINTEDVLHPTIEVTSDTPAYPPEGGYEIPKEHVHRITELNKIFRELPPGKDRLAIYELAKVISEVIPQGTKVNTSLCYHPFDGRIWHVAPPERKAAEAHTLLPPV